MKETNLKKHQRQIFDILRDLKKFFKENNIEYCLFYGTLLGAIRHKGFIPWDDDIDLIMTIENFEKLKACQKELPSHLSLLDIQEDKEIPPKIVLTNSEIVTKDGVNKLFIDIFPFHFLNKKQKQQIDYCDAFDFVWKYRKEVKKSSFIKYFLYRSIVKPVKLIGNHIRSSILEEIKKQKTADKQYVCYLWNDFKNDTVYPWHDIYPFSEGLFEGETFPIPKNWDPILRITYSDDYMTPVKTHTHIL